MLGSIEELEKNIEEFQKNVAASGELCALLESYVDQIRLQNDSFNKKSEALLSKLSDLPETIGNQNVESNKAVRESVSKELNVAVSGFKTEQDRYIASLEEAKRLLEDASAIPETIKRNNIDNNAIIKEDVKREFNTALQSFYDTQKQYLTSLEETRNIINDSSNKITNEYKEYGEELQRTQETIKTYESQLELKYQEFTKTLDSMNVSNLYNQNLELKKALDKKTTLLMILAVASIAIGIVGLFI